MDFTVRSNNVKLSLQIAQALISATFIHTLRFLFPSTLLLCFKTTPIRQITAFMQDSAANNTHVSYSSIGKTFNGLDIAQATVSPGGNALREVIFLECGIHAKEWIGPSTCIWIFDQVTFLFEAAWTLLLILSWKLASGYGSNPEITALVEKYDWVIVPIINPDGYDYSWTSVIICEKCLIFKSIQIVFELKDRLWRKNRALIADSPCTGVDINRNYDANFGGIGSSALPCSDKVNQAHVTLVTVRHLIYFAA